MLDLLGSGVHLLLALLGTTTEPQDEMERGLFLDIVVGQGSAILELLAGENQPLLIWRDSLLVFDGLALML